MAFYFMGYVVVVVVFVYISSCNDSQRILVEYIVGYHILGLLGFDGHFIRGRCPDLCMQVTITALVDGRL